MWERAISPECPSKCPNIIWFPSCHNAVEITVSYQGVCLLHHLPVFLKAVLTGVATRMGKHSLFVMLTLLQFSRVMTLIREQLNEDIVTNDFDIGFVSGSSVVRIRNRKDLLDMWSELRKPGNKITLWCDGLVDRSGNCRKWAQTEDVGSDSEPTISRPPKRKQTDREDKVQEIVDNLKETHSSHYTSMQLRIWAEMIASGMHSSLEAPPNTTMFVRAGGGTPHKRKDQPSRVKHWQMQ